MLNSWQNNPYKPIDCTVTSNCYFSDKNGFIRLIYHLILTIKAVKMSPF